MRSTWLRTLLALGLAALAGSCGGGGGGSSFDLWIPGGVVVADFNADGRADVAVALEHRTSSSSTRIVRVYLQSASGALMASADHAVPEPPWKLTAADVDGDGRTDLVVQVVPAAGTDGGFSVLLADAARPGAFLPAMSTFVGSAVSGLAVADMLEAPGAEVLLAAGSAGVQLYTAQGVHLQRVSVAGAAIRAAAGADLDGNGRGDLVAASDTGVYVLHQPMQNRFDGPALVAGGTRFSAIRIADLDADGRPDIVAVDAGNAPGGGTGGAGVVVALQQADGTFVVSRTAVADGAVDVAIADLDRDGTPELVVLSIVYQSQRAFHGVTVLRRGSGGVYAAAAQLDGPPLGSFVAAGDVTGDGRPDIVIGDGPSLLQQLPDRSFAAYRSF